jgi:hypothetical protein
MMIRAYSGFTTDGSRAMHSHISIADRLSVSVFSNAHMINYSHVKICTLGTRQPYYYRAFKSMS